MAAPRAWRGPMRIVKSIYIILLQIVLVFHSNATTAAIELSLSFDIASPQDDEGASVPADRSVPVTLNAELSATDDGVFIENIALTAPGSEVRGRAGFHTGTERPRLEVELRSPRMDLSPLFPAEPGKRPQRERWFPAGPIPAAWLRMLDAVGHVSIGALQSPISRMENLDVPIRLEDGVLRIESARASVAGGSVELQLVLAAASDARRVRAGTRIDIRGLEPEQLRHAPDEPWVTGLRTDLSLELAGSGASIAEILGGSDGRLLVDSARGRLPDAYVDLFAARLLWDAFRKLSPASSKDAKLRCAALHFSVRDGIAVSDRGIVVQTGTTRLVGSGEVDLGSETFDIALMTLEPSGESGSNLARIDGTFARPGIHIDPAAKFNSRLAAGAALATGGLSLLAQRLLAPSTRNAEPCRDSIPELQNG